MPITLSAKKSLRQSLTRRSRNLSWKSRVTKLIKTYHGKATEKKLAEVFSVVDKAVNKGVLKKKRGARIKAKLTKLLKAEVKAVEVKSKKRTSKAAAKKMP